AARVPRPRRGRRPLKPTPNPRARPRRGRRARASHGRAAGAPPPQRRRRRSAHRPRPRSACSLSITDARPSARPPAGSPVSGGGYGDAVTHQPPGTQPPRRFRPRLHWELLLCGVSGHELVGTDAAELRPQDAIFARELDGWRWYRCLRCGSWLPLSPPERPTRRFPPDRDEIELPLRGKAL